MRYAAHDAALDFLAPYGPGLANGMTNHAPMVVEALASLGRPDAVRPWLEAYRPGLLPRQEPWTRTAREDWLPVLGRARRPADWMAFMQTELDEAPWREVLARWTARLAPGLCAAATHGVIRVAHAVRALGQGESALRVHELAEGLGYWAATYQELPTAEGAVAGALRPRDALAKVAVLPEEKRRFRGTIVGALGALDDFPDFAPVIDAIDASAPPEALISALTETFAHAYLANAHDFLSSIVFVHGVTSAAALRALMPHLEAPLVRELLRRGWQAGAALYAAFGREPAPRGEIEPPREDRETLADLAIASGDDHAIKFTEACLGESALNPSPAYLAAARHAIGMLVDV